MIAAAHASASSAAASAGRHEKMRSRLGVPPMPVGLKGPAIETVRTAGCLPGVAVMLKWAS